MNIIIYLTLILTQSVTVLSQFPFAAHQIILWQGGTTPQGTTGVTNSFSFTLSQSYDSSYNSSLAFNGFKMQTTTKIKYSTTLSLTGTTASITLINYSDAKIYYMSFYVIVVMKNTTWVDLQQGCFSFTDLSNYLRTVNDKLVFPQTTFDMTPGFLPAVVYIKDLDIESMAVPDPVIVTPQPMQINVRHTHYSAPHWLGITVKMTNITGRIINSVCLTLIIYNRPVLDPAKIAYFAGQINVDNSVGVNILIPAIYGPSFHLNCSIGFRYLMLYGFTETRQIFFNAQNIGITQQTLTPGKWPVTLADQMIGAIYHVFCIGLCPNNTFFVYGSQTCVPCTQAHCLNCVTLSTCSLCSTNYTVGPSLTCVLCSSLMPNCIACTNSSLCLNCTISNYLNSTI